MVGTKAVFPAYLKTSPHHILSYHSAGKARPPTRQTDSKLVWDHICRSQSQSSVKGSPPGKRLLNLPLKGSLGTVRHGQERTPSSDWSKEQSGLRRDAAPCFRSNNTPASRSHAPDTPSPEHAGPRGAVGSTAPLRRGAPRGSAAQSHRYAFQRNRHVTHETGSNLRRSLALGTPPQVWTVLTNWRGSLFWRQNQERTHSAGLSRSKPGLCPSIWLQITSTVHRNSPRRQRLPIHTRHGSRQPDAPLLLPRTNGLQNVPAQRTSKQRISGFTRNAKLRYTTVFNAHQQEKFLRKYSRSFCAVG